MRLRLGLTFHSVFYAPVYVALQHGLFEQQGLEPEAATFGDGRLMLAALAQGEVDVGVGGIMRSLVSFDRGEEPIPVHFARINDRDGFFLLGRSLPFDWPDLLGRRLLRFAEAPTPWYVLRAHLFSRGLDPDRISLVPDRPAEQAAVAFRRGEADFLQAPADLAEELLRDGVAVIVREMAQELGSLPYSSYCTRHDVLEGAEAMIAAVTRAHVAALQWMQAERGAATWEVIRPSFPEGDPEVLRRAVERLHRLGVWSADATLPQEAFNRLAEMLRRGGLISQIAPYALVCRDEVAQRAIHASGSG